MSIDTKRSDILRHLVSLTASNDKSVSDKNEGSGGGAGDDEDGDDDADDAKTKGELIKMPLKTCEIHSK